MDAFNANGWVCQRYNEAQVLPPRAEMNSTGLPKPQHQHRFGRSHQANRANAPVVRHGRKRCPERLAPSPPIPLCVVV